MKRKITLLGSLFFCLLLIGAVTVFGKSTTLDIPRPLVVDPQMYNEDPEPLYQANNHLFQINSDAFLNKEDILAAVEFPEGSKVTKLELTTWGERKEQKGEARYAVVATERLVWVMEAEVPKYEHARFGTIHNAKVHYVYDAETGDVLNTGFIGTPEKVPLQARRR